MAVSKKRKKKNIIMLLLLLLIAIAVIVAIVLLAGRKDGVDISETTESSASVISVFDFVKTDIAGVSYKINNSLNEFERKDADSEWKIKSASDIPVKQQSVTNILLSAIALKIIDNFEPDKEVEAYGITSASDYILLTTTSGEKSKLLLGDIPPAKPSYLYCCLDNSKEIYIIQSSIKDKLIEDINEFKEFTNPEAIANENMKQISYKDKNQEIILYNEPDDLKASEAIGTTTWYYRLYNRYMATGYNEMVKLLGYISEMKYVTVAEYSAPELDKFGLDTPFGELKIDYVLADENEAKVDKTRLVRIGDKTEDGYYVMLDDDPNVYIIDSETIGFFTENILADDLLNPNPVLCSFEGIESIDAEYGDKKMNITVKEKADEEKKFDCTLNGNAYDETETRSLFANLIRIAADHFLKDEPNIGNVVFECVYHTNFEDRPEIEYRISEYDNTYYLLTVDGHSKYLITKQEFKILISNIEAFFV